MNKYSVSALAVFIDLTKMQVRLEWTDGDQGFTIINDALGVICDGLITSLTELGEIKVEEIS